MIYGKIKYKPDVFGTIKDIEVGQEVGYQSAAMSERSVRVAISRLNKIGFSYKINKKFKADFFMVKRIM